MSEVTAILSRIDVGDKRAADELLPLVYEELRHLAARQLARESSGQTLQTTALVHEAYLRLVGADVPLHDSTQSGKPTKYPRANPRRDVRRKSRLVWWTHDFSG